MSYIYCITNHVNGKKYIGKTTSSVSKRWKEHCRDYKKERCKDRPLYRAMNKYGIDSFSIEMLEECSSKESSGRETYWINEFKPMVMVIMPLPVEMVLLFGTMMKFVSSTLLDIR